MNSEQLKSILMEYPPSMRLVASIERKPAMVMTVAELVIKLWDKTCDFTLLGYHYCIIRERVSKDPSKPVSDWLELDLR